MARKTIQGLRVIEKKTTLPNGYIADLEFIEHPGAALIIPFLNPDTVVLLKQYRPVIDAWIYELPAGTMTPGETPLACAQREIVEETGYAAGRLTRVAQIYLAPGYSTEMITIFRADALTQERARPEADEVITARCVTTQQLRQLHARGRIVDAKTICACVLGGLL